MLSDADSDYLCGLVFEAVGILIDAEQRYILETRLARLLSYEGIDSLTELVACLKDQPPWSALHRQTIEALANRETLFFRDIAMFEMLKSHVLPALIESRSRDRRLTLWSAACSTGQEPYSLVMLLMESFPLLKSWDVKVVATDFSRENLAYAKSGRYNQFEVNRGLPARLLVKYFEHRGDEWELSSDIRGMVELRELNLIHDPPPVCPVDLTLLRNVMIYWNVETKRALLTRIRRALAADGALILGAAESIVQIDRAFEQVLLGGASYYRPIPGL